MAIHTIDGKDFWGTAGAGVLPLCIKTGRFLLPFRSGYVQEPHTWGVWGGKIDDGEEPREAVKREVEEEMGYNIAIKYELIYTYSHGSFKYYNFIGIVTQEFDPELNWETDKFKWVTWDELQKIKPKHFGLEALLKNGENKILQYIKHI